MRAVVQRVRSARVDVGDDRVAAIGPGLVVLLGIGADDRAEDAERLAAKIASLRIFEDRGKMSRTVADTGGEILVVPQFTLYADIRGGRRPDFTHAAPADKAKPLYDAFCGGLRGRALRVATGTFGASMLVGVDADGPVTIVATTDGWAEAEMGRG